MVALRLGKVGPKLGKVVGAGPGGCKVEVGTITSVTVDGVEDKGVDSFVLTAKGFPNPEEGANGCNFELSLALPLIPNGDGVDLALSTCLS